MEQVKYQNLRKKSLQQFIRKWRRYYNVQAAVSSASSSHRWLNCPPSVRLEEQFEKTTSVYAEEGTLAHKIGEIKLRKEFRQINQKELVDRLSKAVDSDLYSKDMTDYVDVYVNTVKKFNEAKATTADAIAIIGTKT